MSLTEYEAGYDLCIYWPRKISNLNLQKILFLSQLLFMKENSGAKILTCSFYAIKKAPVIPYLYYILNDTASGGVKFSHFAVSNEIYSHKLEQIRLFRSILDKIITFPRSELDQIIFAPQGAWYQSFSKKEGSLISDALIYKNAQKLINI